MSNSFTMRTEIDINVSLLDWAMCTMKHNAGIEDTDFIKAIAGKY